MFDKERASVGLPPRIFMYTVDQIATLLEVKEVTVRNKILFYDRREAGIAPKTRMRAVNIMPEGSPPEWRVQERELLRYLRHKGVKFYDRGFG